VIKRGTKREEQREARRNAIIDAAEHVFAQKPFDKVSMREIARRAGISPALIYRYFPNQQHLFVAAFLRGVKELIPRLMSGGDGGRHPSIEEAAMRYLGYLIEREEYFKMMTHFMLHGNMDEELIDSLNEIERSVLEGFDRLFERKGAKKDVRMLSHAFFAALNGILITYRQHPGRGPGEVRRHMENIGLVIARLFAAEIRA